MGKQNYVAKGITVLSLFDGISCGQIALDRCGIKVGRYYASETDKNAIKITCSNYPDTIQIGDVNGINFGEYNDVDLLIGGSPCQDLSRCNLKNLGLDGDRSKLFFKYIEALKTVKPKHYLFENVGSMTAENMELISSYFGCQPISINSNLLSPQSRNRYYWTDIKGIVQPRDKGIFVKDIIEPVVERKYYLKKEYEYVKGSNKKSSSGLKYVCGIIGREKYLGLENKRISFSQGNRVYSINGKSCTINANAGGLGGKSGLYYLEDGKAFSNSNIRRLTPLETERLQTIPDNYTASVNETGRYRCIGNGWTVDVIAHILSFLS